MRRRNGSTWIAALALAVASASVTLHFMRPDVWGAGQGLGDSEPPDPGAAGLRPIAELPPPQKQPAPPPVPAAPPVVEVVAEPDVSELARPLVEAIAGRLKLAELAEARLEDQRGAIRRAEVAVETAGLSLELAQLSLRDFREGLYPQLRQAAEANVSNLAREADHYRQQVGWTKALADRGYGDQRSVEIIQLKQEQAEKALEESRSRLRGLVEETVPLQLAELEGRVASARASLETHATDLEYQKTRGLRLRDERDAEALSDRERNAILGLDEAMRLAASGRDPEARGRLAEAAESLRIEQERRNALKRADERRRFDEAARRLRGSGELDSSRP